ncbi:MAG TPA: hypothetical protein VGL59_19505 [Polyangia bacterium]|jgi:hypothetical protein
MIANEQPVSDAASVFLPPFAPLEIAEQLDRLSEDARIKAVMKLRRRQLAPLFEAAAFNEPLRLTDLVPAETPPLTEVIHEGKNSLPLFTRFQKRFCRPPSTGSATAELWGYNEQTHRMATGPGYFVAHFTDGGELIVDYTMLPPGKVPSWPKIIPNSARLSRFIYYQTTDVLRRVSKHVVIGRAFRKGQPFDAWFALVRRQG